MLTLRGIAKAYRGERGRPVLHDVDLTLNAGEYIAIVGESGSGKSTLLNVIAGLDAPDAGSIRFDGIELAGLDDDAMTRLRRLRMGFVFQAFHLLPHLTLAENIALPLALLGVARPEIDRRVAEIAESVGLGDRADSFPRELSGGELQRVAIARALVHRPRLVLADEPTGNLDAAAASGVLAMLRDRSRAANSAVILVTHSHAAAASTDRVYRLSGSGLHPARPAT
ncbi:MAG: ABC transporter ATP-binding protein [Burkholderiales bacterium]|nr:ABC transporter ATP-binding protein [Burkholderiales bacterium]